MSRVAVRLGVFTVVLAGTFGAAYAVGSALPGGGSPATDDHADDHAGDHAGDHAEEHVHEHAHEETGAAPAPAAASSNGFELVADHAMTGMAAFHLRTVGGSAVTEYIEAHGALLHAVLVRPDLSGFQHLHPEIGDDGTWDVTLPAGGPWHLVFEATPAGATSPVIVATDLDDGTSVDTVPLPAPDDTVEVDGLVVARDGFTFTVTAAGRGAASGLEPYLGQPAHLVALRAGDLAFTHLHPGDGDPGVFTFEPGVTDAGTYRLFLQFGHDGDVVTVPFTVVIA